MSERTRKPKRAQWGHTRPFTVRLPMSLVVAVDRERKARGLPCRTDAIVEALLDWLEKKDEQV